MDISVTYDKTDWQSFQRYLTERITKQTRGRFDGVVVNTLIWMVIAATAFYAFGKIDIDLGWLGTAVGLAVVMAGLFVLCFTRYVRRIGQGFEPLQNGCFIGTHKFSITDEGSGRQGTATTHFISGAS